MFKFLPNNFHICIYLYKIKHLDRFCMLFIFILLSVLVGFWNKLMKIKTMLLCHFPVKSLWSGLPLLDTVHTTNYYCVMTAHKNSNSTVLSLFYFNGNLPSKHKKKIPQKINYSGIRMPPWKPNESEPTPRCNTSHLEYMDALEYCYITLHLETLFNYKST